MSLISNTAVTIDTVVPAISVGQIMVSADRKSTKELQLTDAQRIRRAVLPANHWGELGASLNGEASQSLLDVLREAMKKIANDRLRDVLNAEPDAKTVELKEFTVSALLAWSAETAVSRGSITFTRDDAQNWFNASATAAALAAKHGPVKAGPILQYLSNRFGALAAKNHGLKDSSESRKLISIIDDADINGKDASLVAELMGRLEHITKQLDAKAAEATVSMDDI